METIHEIYISGLSGPSVELKRSMLVILGGRRLNWRGL